MRTIFHIDVNSAFLSWTSSENLKTGNGPDLREIPAIIGGDQKTRHGVVLAKSIPAKKFGIHTGEPVVNALKKCPNLVMAPPNHNLYHAYSRRMMDFLHSLTPDIEQVSIDECFLDFTGISHRYPSPYAAARYIKDEIHSRFGFTVNVGISSNKLLAKMASDFEKPDKIHTLFPDEIPQKMWPLPIGELFMAGKSSVKALNNLGIRTIGELAASDPKLITQTSKRLFHELWNQQPVRLLGIRTTKLVDENEPVQLSLFDLDFSDISANKTNANADFPKKPSPEKQKKLDVALDSIRKKYGKKAVTRASEME